MLEILSETKDPLRVQPHLKKCFEGIDTLTFTEDLVITSMNSVEKESVPLTSQINTNRANGAVEKWLLQVKLGLILVLCKPLAKCSDTGWLLEALDLRWKSRATSTQ